MLYQMGLKLDLKLNGAAVIVEGDAQECAAFLRACGILPAEAPATNEPVVYNLSMGPSEDRAFTFFETKANRVCGLAPSTVVTSNHDWLVDMHFTPHSVLHKLHGQLVSRFPLETSQAETVKPKVFFAHGDLSKHRGQWTSRAVSRFLRRTSPSGRELLKALAPGSKHGGFFLSELVSRGTLTNPRSLGPILGALQRQADELELECPISQLPDPRGGDDVRYALHPKFAELYKDVVAGTSWASPRVAGMLLEKEAP